MNLRFAVFALAVAFCVSLIGLTPALSAASVSGDHASGSAKKGKGQKKRVFLVCKHCCQFRTIQKAVNAAGSFKHGKKNAKTRAIVEVMPGKYVEGVVIDGTRRKKNFEDLTIIGAKKNPRKTILEGKNAKGELGAAQNGIEVVDVDGVVMKNLWARNYESNGFFVHAATQSGQHCDGYTMNNLSTYSENLTSAQSTIQDVDMASEMTEFTKDQILEQSGISMLSQAEQNPQAVLKLLGA